MEAVRPARGSYAFVDNPASDSTLPGHRSTTQRRDAHSPPDKPAETQGKQPSCGSITLRGGVALTLRKGGNQYFYETLFDSESVPEYGISRSLTRSNSASWTFAVPRSPAPYWRRPEESCRLLRRSLHFETLAVVPAPVPQQRRDSLWNITIFEKFGATVIFERDPDKS